MAGIGHEFRSAEARGVRASLERNAQREARGCEIHPTGGARNVFSLELWGALAPTWCLNLASGLAGSGIAILEGYGARTGGRWAARLLIRPRRSVDPLAIDYLELADSPPRQGPRPWIGLEAVSLRRTGRKGGALLLQVEGTDQLGFLDVLLRRFAGLGLAPDAFLLESVDGRVRDWFLLRTLSGEDPGEMTGRDLAGLVDVLRSGPAGRGAERR